MFSLFSFWHVCIFYVPKHRVHRPHFRSLYRASIRSFYSGWLWLLGMQKVGNAFPDWVHHKKLSYKNRPRVRKTVHGVPSTGAKTVHGVPSTGAKTVHGGEAENRGRTTVPES